jgi:dCTP deaminase
MNEGSSQSSNSSETTGVYSNRQIKAAIIDGHIVYHPYIEKHIAGSSIDVTLGHWFYRTERNTNGGFYNPFDEGDVAKYFEGPFPAEVHQMWAEANGRKLFSGIPADHPVIVLGPGERILAHTHEFIGIKAPGTSTMQARSTWGRNGVAVCLDAGWGDPGYINRWTMEIYNMNQNHSVVLPVGERIAQIVFYHTGPVDGEYKQISGKYQSTNEDDLQQLMRDWRPEQMLPRGYKDTRRKPKEL